MHTVGLIQFMGFYVPLVHCRIMQSDLLHVKSYAFEGFQDFVFGECYAEHVLSPQNTVHFVLQFRHDFEHVDSSEIDSSHDSESVLDLLKLICACCAGTIPIYHNAPAPHIFLWV